MILWPPHLPNASPPVPQGPLPKHWVRLVGAALFNQETWSDDTGEQLTTAEIVELVTAPRLQVDFGAELLTSADLYDEDISTDLVSGEVFHNNYADIHGSLRIKITRELTWGDARIRPYMTLTGKGHTKTWYLGVYVPTTPDQELEDEPAEFDVECWDKLILLRKPVGDTYVVTAGTAYLSAVETVIAASGATGVTTKMDTSAIATTLTDDMVWILDPSHETTWLDVVNDLLAAINYRGLYCDTLGRYRSEVYASPDTKTPVWDLDLTDSDTQIVGERRRLVVDEFDKTNWWRFVRNGVAAPVEGTGFYTVDNSGTDPEHRKVMFLDVESQTELESRGDAIVERAGQQTYTVDITTSPLPVLWHFDVVDYYDPQSNLGPVKAEVANWRLPLDGSDTTLQLEVLS